MAMNPGMRMMMLDKLREPKRESEYGDHGRRMIGYDRDGPGRERHMPSRGGLDHDRRYPPMDGPMPGWELPPMGAYGYGGEVSFEGYGMPESGRRRDRKGRYMMGGMDHDDDDDDKYHLKGSGMIAGTVWSGGGHENVDERKAMEWTKKMQNPDGSAGPHFPPPVAEQLRAAHAPKCDKWEFMVALNMMYADYSEVAKKFAADKPEFYVCMAKAFLEDPDAGEGKLAKYMEVIPE